MKVAALVVGMVALVACSKEPPAIQADRVVTTYAEQLPAMRAERRSVLVIEPPPVVQKIAREECRIGTRVSCMPTMGGADDGESGGPYRYCMRGADGLGHYSWASCNTPLAFAPGNAPVAFTRVATDFHIGEADRTEWVSAQTPWLGLDRNGNGVIDSERELFAGFKPLAALDVNGDGVLDKHDPAFGELVFWSDANQDKTCTPSELRRVAAEIARIPLAASEATPQLGSYEGETVAVDGGRIVDVYLAADASR